MTDQQDLESYNRNLRMRDLAGFYIGVQEQMTNGGPLVENFQKAVDGIASGESWCMCFLQFLAKETARVHGAEIKVMQSESVLHTWNQTNKLRRRTDPIPGFWALWQKADSWSGHAGIVKSVGSNGTFLTIEGNTSAGPGINREGDGVYLRQRRLVSTQQDFKLLGFLKVFD